MRGRPPKPTHLKLVTGNPGKRPLKKGEPKPPRDLLRPPAWLSAQQKIGWTYAIASAPAGMLKEVDSAALSIFVISEDFHRQACEELATSSMIASTPNGMAIASVYMTIMNKQALIMLRSAAELGFTPASRSRVTITPEPGPADEFFG